MNLAFSLCTTVVVQRVKLKVEYILTQEKSAFQKLSSAIFTFKIAFLVKKIQLNPAIVNFIGLIKIML